MAKQPNVDEKKVEIPKSETLKSETPTEERKEKPESEVMTIDAPKEFLESETSAKEESEEKKPSSKEIKSEESSSEDVKETPEENLSDEDKRHLSERTQKRIRELNEKAKKADQLEEELEELRSKQQDKFVGQYENTVNQNLFGETMQDNSSLGDQTPNSKLPWDTPNEQPKEITMEEYQRNVLNTADILVQARMSQLNKANEIKSDLEKVESKYPELNPDSDEYSEDISNKISDLFKNQLKADSDTRLIKFVDNIMSLRKKSEQKGRNEATTKIVEQKAEEAISAHDIEPEAEKSFEKMTLDEKEKYLKEKGLW